MPDVVALTDSFVPSLPKGWNAAVRIKLADGTTDATVYADANGDATGANPLPLATAGFGRNYDGNGGWQCYVAPGDYVVSVTPHGGSEHHASVTVAAAAVPVSRGLYEVYGTPSAHVPVPTWNPTTGRLEFAAGGGGGGGGASEQSVKITKFAFDHSTASLKNGVVAYTPAVGEILLDLWVEVTEAWNGTTPKCDVGFFLTSGSGLFAAAQGGALIDLAVADAQDGANDSNAPWTGPLLAQSDAAATPSSLAQSWAGLFTPGFPPNRGLPAKFTDVTPLKVCVSTNGNSSGGSPTGSTAGSAVVYFATAIPA